MRKASQALMLLAVFGEPLCAVAREHSRIRPGR
jgi:hypothetical protein